MSESWKTSVAQVTPGFSTVRWEKSVEVPVVTLDSLIESYGVPTFCKIDVEGYEAEVLKGLTQPLAGLSLEFVAGQLAVASACVQRLRELGTYRFNFVPGEARDVVCETWMDADEMLAWLESGADGVASGDIYAVLEGV
jgi:hypothetical protein